jgi:hypothetical protein
MRGCKSTIRSAFALGPSILSVYQGMTMDNRRKSAERASPANHGDSLLPLQYRDGNIVMSKLSP